MNLKNELKKILIVVPAAAFLMFGIDYFFVKSEEYGVWVMILSLVIFYWAINKSSHIKKDK